jgi:RNA polymerase sigma factor (sigma-70 family)
MAVTASRGPNPTIDSVERAKELARQAIAGDGEAFDNLVRACIPMLGIHIRHTLALRGGYRLGIDDKDVLQNVWVAVLEARQKKSFPPPDNPLAWLNGIAFNQCMTCIRHASKEKGTLPLEAWKEQDPGENSVQVKPNCLSQQVLEAMLLVLSDEEFELLILYSQGWTWEDLAERLGVTSVQAWRRGQHVIRKVKKALLR